MIQLIEGIIYLHENGVAHQDIKPENILVETNNSESFKRLVFIDFGTARIKKVGD